MSSSTPVSPKLPPDEPDHTCTSQHLQPFRSIQVSSAFVLLVGVIAALVPTLRALSIDPASTLRND